MKRLLMLSALLCCLLLPLTAQQQLIFDDNVRTLCLVVDGNPTLPPMLIDSPASGS